MTYVKDLIRDKTQTTKQANKLMTLPATLKDEFDGEVVEMQLTAKQKQSLIASLDYLKWPAD
jgi:hypothetical protein